MVYCTRCGQLNDDEAGFCKNCSKPIEEVKDWRKGEWDKEWKQRFEDNHRSKMYDLSILLGVLLVTIGIWLIIEFVVNSFQGMPDRVYDIRAWMMIPFAAALFIIAYTVKLANNRPAEGVGSKE